MSVYHFVLKQKVVVIMLEKCHFIYSSIVDGLPETFQTCIHTAVMPILCIVYFRKDHSIESEMSGPACICAAVCVSDVSISVYVCYLMQIDV